MTATTALRNEHDHILAMIACLRSACVAAEEGGKYDAETFSTGVDFIRNYADAWHHAKEEDLLFPALEEAGMPREGGPIAVMLHEHVLGRTYVRQMADNLDAAAGGNDEARHVVLRFAKAYANLLTQHIQKENNILFNMADQILMPEVHAHLEKKYETTVPAGADADTGRHYEEVVAKLCERWDIDPQQAASVGSAFQCG